MMNVIVKVYDGSKYEAASKVVAECKYTIKGYEVKVITDDELYKMGFNDFDPNNEYLILTFEGGSTGTYRNSFVELFILYRFV